MTLIGLLVTLLVVALVLWAVKAVLPAVGLPENVQRIIFVIIVVVICIYLIGLVFPGALPPFLRLNT